MIPVIVNASSGTGHTEDAFESLRQMFTDAGAAAEILAARDGESLQDKAREALKRSRRSWSWAAATAR